MNNEKINPNKNIINEVPNDIIDRVPGVQDQGEEPSNESNEIITEVPGVAGRVGEVAVKSNTESPRFEFDDKQGSATESTPINEERVVVHRVDQ